MRRTPRPAHAGDRLTVLDRPRWDLPATGESTGTVERCYWDAWLFGGAWRIFLVADDEPDRVRTHYSDRDLPGRVPDLLDLLEATS